MTTVGYESDDRGVVAVAVGPELGFDWPVWLQGTLQGADGEGRVQAGVEVLVSPSPALILCL